MLTLRRLFLIFVSKLCEIPFLQTLTEANEKMEEEPPTFTEDDDLDLCLYYLRTLSHVLGCAAEISWNVLASKHVSFHGQQMQISCKTTFYLQSPASY